MYLITREGFDERRPGKAITKWQLAQGCHQTLPYGGTPLVLPEQISRIRKMQRPSAGRLGK